MRRWTLEFDFVIAKSGPKALIMIPPHLSHTRELRLHGILQSHSDSIREIYSCEAPALEHFEFTGTNYFPVTFPDLGGDMLFKGNAPKLRAFSLSRDVIPWSLVPRGLTQLKIAGPDEDDRIPSELDQLIDLLVNCPALEILALESCLPDQLAEYPHIRTIHLPTFPACAFAVQPPAS